MEKLVTFFKESVDEIRSKVTWPKGSELQNHTTLVLVASLIFALVIGVIDFVFENLVKVLYNL
jgi:preprotein translocase subunit SecE